MGLIIFIGLILFLSTLFYFQKTKTAYQIFCLSFFPLPLIFFTKDMYWAYVALSLSLTAYLFSWSHDRYQKIYKSKFSLFWSGVISVSLPLSIIAVLLFFTKNSDPLVQILREVLTLQSKNLPEETRKILIEYSKDSSKLMSSFFLGLTLFYIFILACSLSLIKNIKITTKNFKNLSLSNFSVPPVALWIFIASLALPTLATFDQTVQNLQFIFVSQAVAFVIGSLFFIQGLAVITYTFELFHVGAIWRSLWVLMILFNPPAALLIAFIGLIDYWVDLRLKLRLKKQASKKRSEQ